MNSTKTSNFLRDNVIFWSRAIDYHPVMQTENGTPIVYNGDMTNAQCSQDQFADAGVKIHSCSVHSGWLGVNRYDYTLCDKVVQSTFASGKVDYFIPRITIDAPLDWCRENPADVFVYYEGPRSAEEVKALVGTLKQDYFGYESEIGWRAVANGDSRPNVGGVIARQSFSSEKWVRDAGEALRRVIQHLEKSFWSDKIIAYHVCYGNTGEALLWSRGYTAFGDWGENNIKRFREWGIQKYGSWQAAVNAWGNGCEEEIIPSPALREKSHMVSDDFYKDEIKDRWSIDYDIFTSEMNTDAAMYFCKIAKEASCNKPVGMFYGYILHLHKSACCGHLGYERLLKSGCVDFFAAPKSYNRSGPGEPGGEMAPAVSINNSALWIDECDNRTHLALRNNRLASSIATLGCAACPEETYAVLLREFCKNISHNSGLWYMDLGSGWFDDEGIMAHIASIVKVSSEIRKLPHHSVAQLTVIVDENSVMQTHPTVTWHTENFLRNLQLTGTPLDVIFSFDIENLDLSATKLAVLMTPLCADNYYIDRLRKALPADAHILYCGKTRADNGVTLINRECSDFPYYKIEPSNADEIVCIEKDEIIAVKNSAGDYVLSTLHAEISSLRAIIEHAGVHCYAPMECAVYADNRIISFFPKEDVSFVPDFAEQVTLTDLLTGTPCKSDSTLNIKAKSGAAFKIQ